MTVEAHAPGRVVLIGDHTDHAGGVSLTMAIDLGTTVTGEPGGDRVRLTSSQADDDTERFVQAVAEEVAALGPGRPPVGLTGSISTTVPVGAGLSSSAALELSVALAIGFRGTPIELARLGQRAEHRAVGVPSGLLDQLSSAAGVEGHALLLDLADGLDDAAMVVPVPMPDDVDVLVVHSGQERTLAGSAYAERTAQCEQAAGLVGPLPHASADDVATLADPVLRRRARHVATECARVHAAAEALRAGDATACGRLMLESHASLRDDFEVSTDALDTAVSRLMAMPGVLGARLTGAGFGGCVVALCERGAVADPSGLTGRGWLVRPAAGASVRREG
jgi:galactokinase